jgi:hypothetical protein
MFNIYTSITVVHNKNWQIGTRMRRTALVNKQCTYTSPADFKNALCKE